MPHTHRETGFFQKDMDLLRRRMAEKGLKTTPQRDELAGWIFQTHEHFTVEDIINAFREKGQKIAQATAYRVVQMMLELGLLLEHDFGKGYKYYEHTPGHEHHDHIICEDCGKILEFSDPELEALKQKITASHGFVMKKHYLNIYASCTRCPAEKKILTNHKNN